MNGTRFSETQRPRSTEDTPAMPNQLSQHRNTPPSHGAGSAAALAAGFSVARFAHGAGSDTVKIALIGCGNRGTGACRESLLAADSVKLIAVADLFADRAKASLANLTKYDELRPKIDVPDQRQFFGFDAYRNVLQTEVDLVLLATPPHFRPDQYTAAVTAGKHVFMEKPCCIDAPGYRALLAANEEARRRKLSVVVGLQRRHQSNYLEGIQRIRDGEIGEVLFLRTYFNVMGGGRAGQTKPDGMSEMEYQLRYWGMFAWLCGDHIVEQSTHEIDVANWVMDDHPVRAQGMGGRQVRFGPGNGTFWDHHAVEFEYPGGVRLFAQARQQAATWVQVSDNIHGTKESVTLGSGPWGFGKLTPRDLRRRRDCRPVGRADRPVAVRQRHRAHRADDRLRLGAGEPQDHAPRRSAATPRATLSPPAGAAARLSRRRRRGRSAAAPAHARDPGTAAPRSPPRRGSPRSRPGRPSGRPGGRSRAPRR